MTPSLSPALRAVHPRGPMRPGLTLIEMVVALVVMGVILATLSSIFAISMKAFPAPAADQAAIAASLQDAAGMIKDDLSSAVSVVSVDSSSIQFRVADRDRDGAQETIAYRWPGAGSAVMRSYKGGSDVAVGPELSAFSIDAWWRKFTVATPTATTLGSDETLFRYPGAAGTSLKLGTDMLALTFTPTLAADATHWKLSTVTATGSGTTLTIATLRARLYLGAITDLSSQSPIASSPGVSLGLLGSPVAVDFTFFGAPEVPAGTLVSIVIDATVSVGTVRLNYTSSGVPSSSYIKIGSGSSWSTSLDGGLPITIGGKQRRPGSTGVEEYRLDGAGFAMTPSAKGAFPARFSVATMSKPKTE